jgi:adenine deaminase
MPHTFNISGNIVDIRKRSVFPGEIIIVDGKIESIIENNRTYKHYILPGFIDAHVHIESSMLTPIGFSKLALPNGTIATISDPHEIANVTGICGIEYFIRNAKASPFKFFFGVPSCVPATQFETSGHSILPDDLIYLFSKYDSIVCLSEVMNYPDVINDNPLIIEKINIAKKFNKVIDGHAPGLTGENLLKYVSYGISTDHECTDYNEAIEKIRAGMKILIREGSAAKNFDHLYPLIDQYPDNVMICTDDCHPDDLENGHLKTILLKGLSYKIDLFNILKALTINPVLHYNIPVGTLNIGDTADFIVVDSLNSFNVKKTYINGKLVYDSSKSLNYHFDLEPVNTFNANFISPDDIAVPANSHIIKVIEASDKSLFTKSIHVKAKIENGKILQDINNDILKIICLNRYRLEKPSVAFIKGFRLKNCAIAQTIAHDSHNIIALGTSDDDIIKAVNHLITLNGGIVVVNNGNIFDLPLEIAGIISEANPKAVSITYKKLENLVLNCGSKLSSPFMTLSFMSLLVIPELKISDKGLFDVNSFKFTSVYD